MSNEEFVNANKNRPLKDLERGIIRRIAELRLRCFGPRGQARFAAALGISPSTYTYYEKNRVPPASLLVRMAEVTGADLNWLLTGTPAGKTGLRAADSAVLERVRRLLAARPSTLPALVAFLDLLEKVQTVEDSVARGRQRKGEQPDLRDETPPGAAVVRAFAPVLGRTAAAVPRFWLSPEDRRTFGEQLKSALQAVAAGGAVRLEVGLSTGGEAAGSATLVQLGEPVEVGGLLIAEVVDSPYLLARWTDLFGLRIDGDSMRPWLEPDDIVLLSPSVPAEDGDPAVVQLQGQIGVTCKIYRRSGSSVRLIPLNPQYPTTIHPKENVIWALRVLTRLRPSQDGP